MFLQEIELKNYRKFSKIRLKFEKEIVIILGENAAGKTTILEAINVLGSTKTPKNSNLTESVKENEEFFCISGLISDKRKAKRLTISYSNGEKRALVDDKVCSKISEYIKNFLVVYFQPMDSLKYSISSQSRRTLFDSFFSLVSDEYLKELIKYKKVLKEKNAILKMGDFREVYQKKVLLDMMNEKLVESIKKITDIRQDQIRRINFEIKKIHHIFSSSEEAEVRLRPNTNDPEQDLRLCLETDIVAKTSTRGSHKDDYEFIINGKNISEFCSQGQQKSFVLSLKIAMLEILTAEKSTSPVLILDDAFGDLDTKRQNAIFEIIEGRAQTFISTTSLKQIDKKIIEQSQIIEIKKGAEFDEWKYA